MNKGYSLPSPILREYIDRYWFWESCNNETILLPRIYPGSGVEVMFHYKTPFKDFPTSHILCPRNKDRYILKQDGSVGFISVRFKSWAFPYFTNIPTHEMIDRQVKTDDIWPEFGRCIGDEISIRLTFSERIDILNRFFETLLLKSIQSSSEIDWAINYIYYNHDNINLNDLISETNLSVRTFQRRFKNSVGVSAKTFQKISRFQTILKRSFLAKSYPTMDAILAAGYYDQSHFNKDFNALTGFNPTAVISNSNYMAHFYNTSFKY